jgi:hypothetical protein
VVEYRKEIGINVSIKIFSWATDGPASAPQSANAGQGFIVASMPSNRDQAELLGYTCRFRL